MRSRRLADQVVGIVWPLLSAEQTRWYRQFDELQAAVGWLRSQLLRLGGGGQPLPSGPPFPPLPGPGSSVQLYAKGSLLRGQPVMGIAGFPDHVALLTEDEVGVTNYRGWAAQSVADGELVEVWFAGPCPLFAALETNPSPPDSLEVYVYGPYPPVPASQIPPDAYFRRCGEVLDAATVLLGKGDKAKNPPV